MTTENPEDFYTKWRNDPREPLERWKAMPLTWSQYSAWLFNKRQWYATYVVGKKNNPTIEMRFGNVVGDRLASDSTYFPEIPRLQHFEYLVEAKLGKKKLLGHIDNYSTGVMHEFKTGKAQWTQTRADSHKQIDFYVALLYLSEKLKPTELSTTLFWLPTKDGYDSDEHGYTPTIELTGEVHEFHVKKTLVDVVNILADVKRALGEMEQYIEVKTQ
jgi:hypothetical protein